MPRCVAFLRGINVGGHVVTMDRLRRLFESAGLSGVETFIASGNVIFDAPPGKPASLERRLESALEKTLGYAVSTFLRSARDVGRIAAHHPFPRQRLEEGALYVGFLADEPPAPVRKKVTAMRTDTDEFAFDGREFYWLCRATRMLDTTFSYATFEKAVGNPATFRNINTVRRLAARYLA